MDVNRLSSRYFIILLQVEKYDLSYLPFSSQQSQKKQPNDPPSSGGCEVVVIKVCMVDLGMLYIK